MDSILKIIKTFLTPMEWDKKIPSRLNRRRIFINAHLTPMEWDKKIPLDRLGRLGKQTTGQADPHRPTLRFRWLGLRPFRFRGLRRKECKKLEVIGETEILINDE